jgi:hypothetical protein
MKSGRSSIQEDSRPGFPMISGNLSRLRSQSREYQLLGLVRQFVSSVPRTNQNKVTKQRLALLIKEVGGWKTKFL